MAVDSDEQLTPDEEVADGNCDKEEAAQLVPANGIAGGGSGDSPGGDGKDDEALTCDVTLLPRLYWQRWLMLLLFCCYSLSSAYQWIHLNIVFHVILAYYNESLPADPTQANLAIDWLSMIYMLAYATLILPAAWLLQRRGLRVSALCATALNFAGALVKCFAASPSRFWLLFFGQVLCAVAQNFILGLPAPLAAAWFGAAEVSTATSLGVFGNQLGVAIGFVVPPLFVSMGEPEAMGGQLLAMYIGGAAVTGLLLVLVAILFRDAPPSPPSLGRAALLTALQRRRRRSSGSVGGSSGGVSGPASGSYVASLKRLASNPNFVLLTASYGLNTGTYYALSTLLNPIIVPEMKKAEINATLTTEIEQQVGWAGFTMIVAGIFGSLLAGLVLDKTRAFKATTLSIYILSCLSTIVFTLTLPLSRMWLVFGSMFLLGFFMTGYLPVGFEFAAEITYPENEGLSSGILNAAAQIMGIICTIIVRTVVDNFSTLAGNVIFCSLLVAGSVMTGIIKSDLRRQRANQAAVSAEKIQIEVRQISGIKDPELLANFQA